MKALLLTLALALSPLVGIAAETCASCLAECPHASRDLRACDRGCPDLCSPAEAKKIRRARTCAACLGQCPHKSRILLPCDTGCRSECDRDSLLSLYKQEKSRADHCEEGRGGDAGDQPAR